MTHHGDDDSDEGLQITVKPPFSVKEGVQWAVSQPITNILSLGLTMFLAVGFGYYVVKIEPANRKERDESTAKLVDKFVEHSKADRAESTKQIQVIMETNKDLHKSDMEHAEKAAKQKETLLRELMGHPRDLKNNAEGRDDRGAVMETNPDFPLTG